MTKPLHQRLENFDKLSDNNRRVLIHRLKLKKAKMETELTHIDVILERYRQLKAERLEDRKEAIRNYWRADVV
jgi:hypothetical protein